jgi:phospholipase C
LTPRDLAKLVDTIVVVMMENRSFDHMLGHLRLSMFGNRPEIEGLVSLNEPEYANLYHGQAYWPFRMEPGQPLPSDLPHERAFVHQQLAHSDTAGGHTMRGFVEAYYSYTPVNRTSKPEPMGFFAPPEVPVTHFLAQNFAVCNKWFSPLPASTQPNRLVALSGYSSIDVTRSALLPDQPLVFQWLTKHKVRWRVYHAGLSFMMLFRSMWDELVGPHFSSLAALARDFQREADKTFPQVIFVEPDYSDSPVHLASHPNDNHPPLPVGFGEDFVRSVYQAVSQSKRWQKTVMIVTYDEHGGFFDHVPPLPIPARGPTNEYLPFDSTGVRVPAIVMSPLVDQGAVHDGNLDHTSLLQFLAERFAPKENGYSSEVNARRDGKPAIGSVSAVLTRKGPRPFVPPAPSTSIRAVAELAGVKDSVTPNQQAFAVAIEGLLDNKPEAALAKYPEMAHWDGAP